MHYERYEKLDGPKVVYYPAGEEARARWLLQAVDKASERLSHLLGQVPPTMEILLASVEDWSITPRDEPEENSDLLPYWTGATSPSSLVVPVNIDPVFGKETPERLAFILYHALTLAFLESDPRPWPEEYPLWADEWQLKFAAVWLAQNLDGQQGLVNKDLHAEYEEIFEPEADGKTPVTIRGFDWFEDTSAEDYLAYELLLEQFAVDLLERYDASILPRFLALYRTERPVLLSDDVTSMLASALGPESADWLEELVYF